MSSFAAIAVGSVIGVPVPERPVVLIPGAKVAIRYPARLEAMALDPSKVAEREDRIYSAGQIDFTVAIFKHLRVQATTGNGEIMLSDRTQRPSLVRHAALLMQRALRISDTLSIDVTDDVSLRHCGLGSSSGTIAAVASAINELYGNPLSARQLTQYCAQNHGEEIDGDDTRLVPVQCLGGSAVSGNYPGGLIILAGRATPIFQSDLLGDAAVVIGVPLDYTHPDSQELMQREADNMAGFVASGNEYGKDIAYRLIHQVMPGLVNGSVQACKELIHDYRWNMGSIRNCSFVLPRINEIAEALRRYADDETIKIFSLSSVGPGFFAVTSDPEKVERDFAALNMQTYRTTIYNGTYSREEKA